MCQDSTDVEIKDQSGDYLLFLKSEVTVALCTIEKTFHLLLLNRTCKGSIHLDMVRFQGSVSDWNAHLYFR